ncbi:precorrin-2 C(20)-methyltransferase [Bacteroides zoogleoformans]|uniref:precorrin-2 C(20)-methyltransferase n=1 Tax=Bacteroides zoogleoformans TaxID=28119 RepID=UPI00248DE76C|nr:precorrin-2 C(20)-methyltransferase [Bacteroides zoogleoformans]
MYSVLFVSLGPGDPELITVKGLKALQNADCIFCPETVNKKSLTSPGTSHAAAILHQLEINTKCIIRFAVPMSRQRDKAMAAYDSLFAEIEKLHADGKKICVAAEGDAGFYASIHYVYERLQKEGIPVEHIAGVPSFIAAGARAGIHLVSGTETLTVLPGTATADEVARHIEREEAVVIMKLSKCAQNMHELIRLHPEYDYHYFENVGTANDVYLDRPDLILSRAFPYFSMLIARRPENADMKEVIHIFS